MNASRRAITVVAAMVVLTATVLSPGATLQVVADEGGIDLASVTSSAYGTFKGVAYMQHTGRYFGTAVGYSVPFEIIAPADPTRGNGVVLMEPVHGFGGSPGGKGYLTPEFLFSQGFSLAVIGWHPDDVDPFVGYSMEEAVEILHNFALALWEDPVAQGILGDIERIYGIGVSKTCEPMHGLVHSPGNSVLDLTFLVVPTWAEATHQQPQGSHPVMVFLAESDLVRSQVLGIYTEALRGSSDTYRSYEVAGAPHVPDVPFVRAVADPMGLSPADTTPLDWTPVLRALFMAGHGWVTEGVEPPPSMALDQASAGEIDPVYQAWYGLDLQTGIARDPDGNGLGGIRLPDLAIGRGQFVAFDPASFAGWGLYGDFEDLQCEPLADGSARFRNHGAYVSAFTLQANSLVAAGFLLSEDASQLVSAAAQSEVGNPQTCPPALLPVTGGAKH